MRNTVILVHLEMVTAEMLLFSLAVVRILGLSRTLVLFVFGMCSPVHSCAAAEVCVRVCWVNHSCGIVWCSTGELELSYEEGRSKSGSSCSLRKLQVR